MEFFIVTYSQDSLLIFRKGILTDKLHNFREFVFQLKNLFDGLFEHHELRVDFTVILL